jgi:LDH2 family malate/lactate/ureidoglycolate dehydrogenase
MLGGGAFGLEVTALTNPRGQRPAEVSHMFAAIDLRRFVDLDRFRTRMDAWLDALRSSPKVDGEPRIYIPGEKEWEAERRNRVAGVVLPPPVAASLDALAARLGLEFPPRPAAERPSDGSKPDPAARP